MQPNGLSGAAFAVVCQQRRNFERRPAIDATGGIVSRAKKVRCLSQVIEREFEKQRFPRFTLSRLLADVCVVCATGSDGLVEDRGVRCESGDGEIADIAPQRTVRQQIARYVV